MALGSAPQSPAWCSGGGGMFHPLPWSGNCQARVCLCCPLPPAQTHILDLDCLAHQGHQQHAVLHGLREGVGIGDFQCGWGVGKHLWRNLLGESSGSAQRLFPGPQSGDLGRTLLLPSQMPGRVEGLRGGAAKAPLHSFVRGDVFCYLEPFNLYHKCGPKKGSPPLDPQWEEMGLKSGSQKLMAARPSLFSSLKYTEMPLNDPKSETL